MISFSVVVWLVTLSKIKVSWRNRFDPLARSFWFALAGLATVLTLDQPSIYRWLGEVSGLPNISIPFTTSAGVAAGFWCQFFLRHALGRSANGRWRAAAAIALVVVVFGSYLPGAYTQPNTHDSIHTPPQTWGELIMRMCLAAWGIYTLTDISRLCLRFSRIAGARPLRWGMALAAIGAPLVSTRLLVEYGLYAPWAWRHAGQSEAEHVLIKALNIGALAGFATIALGLGLPALVRRLTSIGDWLRDLVRYQRLGRLWRILRPAVPTFAWPRYRLPLVHRVPVFALRGRLYRRIVEIQDGFFALQPYRSLDYEIALERRTSDLDDRVARAYIDAHALRSALPRFSAGLKPLEVARPRTQTMLDDVTYLLLVSAALPRERSGRFAGVRGSGADDRDAAVAVQTLE